jgi:hypothetical protein
MMKTTRNVKSLSRDEQSAAKLRARKGVAFTNAKPGKGITIGKKPKYVTSNPSVFMKNIEKEIQEKRIKDEENRKEYSTINEETPDVKET